MAEIRRVPVICVDSSSVDVFSIFNPNDWPRPASRAVITSCASELSTLEYAKDRIAALCSEGMYLCRGKFESLRRGWGVPGPAVEQVQCFAQVPELHVLIEGFFASLKSLLDLVIQMLSTERIVSIPLDGFHRDKRVFGGVVLNALERNVPKEHKSIAEAVRTLLLEHKARWIDDVIATRDALIHPARGVYQLMFELIIRRENDTLVLLEARPPHAVTQPIHAYASERVVDARELATSLLNEIRGAA